MRNAYQQVSVGVLALSAADVGGWAQFAPRSFYRSFPSAGHHWVAGMGPYNEHLVRDVGGLYLALGLLSLWALVRPSTELRRLVGVTWLVFSVPHLVFHLFHLDMFDTFDKMGNIVTLGGTVLLAALLLPASSSPPRATPEPTSVPASPAVTR